MERSGHRHEFMSTRHLGVDLQRQPQTYCRELNEGQIVGRELVEACRGSPTLFDHIEEPLDHVARPVEMRAKADLSRPAKGPLSG